MPRVQPLVAIVSACLFALAVRPLAATLSLSTTGLAIALGSLLFVLGFLLSMIEASVFSDGPSSVRPRHVLGALAAAAIVAVATSIVTPTAGSGGGDLRENLFRWIDRQGSTLHVRIAGSAVAFMLAYCVIGSIAWRFVRPWYTDPKYGLRLRVPSGPWIILLQLGRGLLAVLALAPLIASTSARGFDWWCRFALALTVTSAVVPLLHATEWPVKLRVIHAIEIAVFSLVYAFALQQLFGA